eukprot:3984946-Alexandrium_andersonii.AAC.1
MAFPGLGPSASEAIPRPRPFFASRELPRNDGSGPSDSSGLAISDRLRWGGVEVFADSSTNK